MDSTSVSSWRKPPHPLPVPSGNKALVRPIGISFFISTGQMPASLMTIFQDAVKAGQQGKPAPEIDTDDFDAEKMADLMKLVDSVCVEAVIAPNVVAAPKTTGHEIIPIPQREVLEDALWVDEVDIEDKMHIFQFVLGGAREMMPFREGEDSSVADVGAVEGVEDSPGNIVGHPV